MSNNDPLPLPAAPNPLLIAQIAGQARTLIAVLAGLGLLGGVWAAVSAEQIANILTAVLTIGGFAFWAGAGAWSWWQKRRSSDLAHVASVASAGASAVATMQADQPVALVVQPAVALAAVAPIEQVPVVVPAAAAIMVTLTEGNKP